MVPTSSTSPLVGREAERARLLDVLRGGDALHGALIVGERGTGCTWLSRDVARTLAADGWAVHRLACSAATRDLQFGALAHVLSSADELAAADDGDDPQGLVSVLRRCRSVLGDGRGATGTLVVADDVHHVDAATCAVVLQLLRSDGVLLLATTRPELLTSPVMQALDQGAMLDRCELGPLDRAGSAELAESILGAPLDGSSVTALFDATGGLPLAVSEVTRAGLASGTLTMQHGLFHLDGAFAATPAMSTTLLAGVGALGAGARRLLRTIAVAQPVPLEPLETESMLDHLLELDAAGWILSESTPRGPQVRMRSAAARLALAADVSLLERRALLRELTAMIETSERWRSSHPLQLAAWRVDAGMPADADLLVAGAREAAAERDYRTAGVLAELATRERRDIGMTLLRAECLYEVGAFTAADRLLRETVVDGDDEVSRLLLGVTHHRVLYWGLTRSADSAVVLAELLETLTDPKLRSLVVISQANTLVFDGHHDAALETMARLDPSDELAALATAFPRSVSTMFVGRPVEAAAIAAASIEARRRLTDQPPLLSHPLLDHLALGTAQIEAGLLAESFDAMMRGYHEALTEAMPQLHVWFLLGAARSALQQGRLRTAMRLFGEARHTCEEITFVPGRRLSLVGQAVCAWYLGDREGTLAGHAELLAAGDDIGFYAAEAAWADAVACLADDDPAGACAALRRGAAMARERGEHTIELELLWEAARAGEPASVGERVAELGDIVQGDLAAARVMATAALQTGDPDALEAAEQRFAACGAHLVAAELADRAARGLRDRGLVREAGRAARRAAGHRERCEGFPPASDDSARVLSEREREVAMLVLEGLSSKEIATKLTVSVRTVSNHLQSIYSKLGISRRAELADALG